MYEILSIDEAFAGRLDESLTKSCGYGVELPPSERDCVEYLIALDYIKLIERSPSGGAFVRSTSEGFRYLKTGGFSARFAQATHRKAYEERLLQSSESTAK